MFSYFGAYCVPDVLVFINIMIKTYLWTNAPARTMMAITTRTLTTPPTLVIEIKYFND